MPHTKEGMAYARERKGNCVRGPRPKIYYPILEAAIRQLEAEDQDLAERIQVSPTMFNLKKKGNQDWRLNEAITLRDIVAPYLTLEELFTPVPNFMEPPKRPTEEEQRHGFDPKWLTDNEEEE
jgi:hypothetical protein